MANASKITLDIRKTDLLWMRYQGLGGTSLHTKILKTMYLCIIIIFISSEFNLDERVKHLSIFFVNNPNDLTSFIYLIIIFYSLLLI